MPGLVTDVELQTLKILAAVHVELFNMVILVWKLLYGFQQFFTMVVSLLLLCLVRDLIEQIYRSLSP